MALFLNYVVLSFDFVGADAKRFEIIAFNYRVVIVDNQLCELLVFFKTADLAQYFKCNIFALGEAFVFLYESNERGCRTDSNIRRSEIILSV